MNTAIKKYYEMGDGSSGQIDPITIMKYAINALYLEVDSSIADDIRDKFYAVLAAQPKQEAIEQQGNINNDAWVSVSDLPPECTVVLGYNEKWIDDDFEPEGIRESFYNDGDWCSAVWNNEQDCWDTDWEAKPTYWMQRPSPPNQKLNH